MIEFGYLSGWSTIVRSVDPLGFFNKISDELDDGHRQRVGNNLVVADFDSIIYLTGTPLATLVDLAKEFQAKQPSLPTRDLLQVWNQLVLDLYPDNSVIQELKTGHIRGTGLRCPGQKLYGGHLSFFADILELVLSLSSTELQFELWTDMSLGLQSLSAIIARLESAQEIDGLNSWRLTLKPGMLYEEIYNGRDTKESYE